MLLGDEIRKLSASGTRTVSARAIETGLFVKTIWAAMGIEDEGMMQYVYAHMKHLGILGALPDNYWDRMLELLLRRRGLLPALALFEDMGRVAEPKMRLVHLLLRHCAAQANGPLALRILRNLQQMLGVTSSTFSHLAIQALISPARQQSSTESAEEQRALALMNLEHAIDIVRYRAATA